MRDIHNGCASPSSAAPAVYAVVGAQIVLGAEVLTGHAALVVDGRIRDVVPESACPTDLVEHRLDGGYLAPGFIDIHVHGAAGASYNDGTAESVITASRALLAAGVTTLLPTVASAPIGQIHRSLDALQIAAGASDMPRLVGAHLEGPYFAVDQRGAQSVDDLRTPDDGTTAELLDRHAEIRMLSLAPELPGAVELIRQLVRRGVIAAAGHTDGTADDLVRAQDAGLSHVIHLYSGQSTIRRRSAWRIPGMLEATLASTDLTVELIADGKHLPPTLMTIAHRALGDRLCLVSDATAGAGLSDGSSYRMGNVEYVVDSGVGMTLDHTSFGGSTTLLPAMLPIARQTLGLSVADAVAMVTSVPARAARLTDVGHLAAGSHADMVHLDEQLRVRAVAQGGRWRAAMNHLPPNHT